MKPKKSISTGSPKHEINLREAFAERLRQATKNHEIAVLASKVGVTPATLYRWLNAKFDPSIPKLAELAEAMNVNLAWLVTGQGPIDAGQAGRHALLEQYGTTEFESATGASGKAPLAFYEPWLFKLLYGSQDEPTVFGPTDMNPPLLIEVGDDSMEPTIAKGDLLLIDRSFGLSPSGPKQAMREGRSAYDGICAFRSGSPNGDANRPTGHLIIRRIQYRLDGTLAIRCDNPRYPEEAYTPKKTKPPVPVGRVIWRGGRV
jgi:phage repressor protein C with HTH and peptisase S24 domain